MPWKPKTHNPRPNARAEQRRQYDKDHYEDRAFYWSEAWRRFRRWFLSQHPLCEECGKAGKVTAAKDVDHIKGRREHPELAFDEGNCRALCHSHHSRRTAKDQGFAKGKGG